MQVLKTIEKQSFESFVFISVKIVKAFLLQGHIDTPSLGVLPDIPQNVPGHMVSTCLSTRRAHVSWKATPSDIAAAMVCSSQETSTEFDQAPAGPP